MKRIISVLLVLVLCVGLFCGCDTLTDVLDSTEAEKAKTFEFEGLSIELTTDFLRMNFVAEEFDFVVGNEEIAVMGLKVPADDMDLSDVTALDYAKTVHSGMEEQNPTEVTELGGIPTFQYEALSDEDELQRFAVMFYKGNNCFWVVMFGAETDDFAENYDEICKYAKTVKCS